MTPIERQRKILEALCVRRHDKCDNLAVEFGVSNATIRRDIAALMCDFPVETICGRYGGGVRVADGFYLSRTSLTQNQIALLRKLRAFVDDDDLNTLNSILIQLAP